MRRTATILLALTAHSALLAKEPVRISLAESPVAGLRERVETHLAQEYDCVVISRSQPVATALEQSITQMKAIHDAAQPPEKMQAADACAWVSAWDEFLLINRLTPTDGVRELTVSVTDLSSGATNTADFTREKVPERSDYERTLAVRVAAALHLATAAPRGAAADKAVTLAVLPLVHHEERTLYTTHNPSDKVYLHMEAALQACLPPGASLLSRDCILAVLAEHKLTGFSEDDGAALRSVAHLLPAQALVCGTVTRRLSNPTELRLDLHLVEPRSGVLLAVWEGRCAAAAGLNDLASAGVTALIATPWKRFTQGDSTAARRLREAQFMLSHKCCSAAWGLAKDQPELFNPLLKGLLRQAGEYGVWMKPAPENPDSFRNRTLRETTLMLDDLLQGRTLLTNADGDDDAVLWPDLIRAETRYWLGEYVEAERLCRSHVGEHPDSLRSRAEMVLAWSLFKQKRFEESKVLLKRVEQQEGLMWGWPGLGGAYVGYWANSLSLALAEQSGDVSEAYSRVKEKMRKAQSFSGPDMKVYLQAVERQEGAEGAIRDLTSLLVYNPAWQYDDTLLAMKKSDLSAQCCFSDLAPAYAVRGRCYELAGNKQKALDDYALFLKVAWYYGYHPQRFIGNEETKSYQMPYATAALEAAKRLEAEGLKPKDDWKSMAETRTVPQDAALYVVPVGICDKTMLDRFIRQTTGFIGGRVEVLPPVDIASLKVTADKHGTTGYDGRLLADVVLRQIEVPDDAIQLVLATSEIVLIRGGDRRFSRTYDGGNTLLLSLRDPMAREAALLCLHYRYTPKRDQGWRMDMPEVLWFLHNTTRCTSPCIFAGDLRISSGEAKGICPSCQEAYWKVDFDDLKRQTVTALKKQGVKIVPVKRP